MLHDELLLARSATSDADGLLCGACLSDLYLLGPEGQRMFRLLCTAQLLCCGLCCGLPLLSVAHLVQRQQLRYKYDLDPNASTFADGLFGACLCLPCSLMDTQAVILQGGRTPQKTVTDSSRSAAGQGGKQLPQSQRAGQSRPSSAPSTLTQASRAYRAPPRLTKSRSGRTMMLIHESDEVLEATPAGGAAGGSGGLRRAGSGTARHSASLDRQPPSPSRPDASAEADGSAPSELRRDASTSGRDAAAADRSSRGANGIAAASSAWCSPQTTAEEAVAAAVAAAAATAATADIARSGSDDDVAAALDTLRSEVANSTRPFSPPEGGQTDGAGRIAATVSGAGESDSPIMEATLRAAVEEQRRHKMRKAIALRGQLDAMPDQPRFNGDPAEPRFSSRSQYDDLPQIGTQEYAALDSRHPPLMASLSYGAERTATEPHQPPHSHLSCQLDLVPPPAQHVPAGTKTAAAAAANSKSSVGEPAGGRDGRSDAGLTELLGPILAFESSLHPLPLSRPAAAATGTSTTASTSSHPLLAAAAAGGRGGSNGRITNTIQALPSIDAPTAKAAAIGPPDFTQIWQRAAASAAHQVLGGGDPPPAAAAANSISSHQSHRSSSIAHGATIGHRPATWRPAQEQLRPTTSEPHHPMYPTYSSRRTSEHASELAAGGGGVGTMSLGRTTSNVYMRPSEGAASYTGGAGSASERSNAFHPLSRAPIPPSAAGPSSGANVSQRTLLNAAAPAPSRGYVKGGEGNRSRGASSDRAGLPKGPTRARVIGSADGAEGGGSNVRRHLFPPIAAHPMITEGEGGLFLVRTVDWPAERGAATASVSAPNSRRTTHDGQLAAEAGGGAAPRGRVLINSRSGRS